MTHQPPLPEAATSPYPLHPDPIPEERKLAAAAEELQHTEDESGISQTAIGVGAAIGLAAAAAVTGVFYARRRSAKAGPRAKGDDKSKRGKPDRSRVAASEPYEVSYFARKHGITAVEARAILKEAGPGREAANALAISRKKG